MRTDVAVIGGGVIGLACAGELASTGARTVVLEANDGVGQGSSSRANGGVRAQFGTVPNIAFSRFSIAAYEALEAETGLLSFHQTGYLLLAGTEAGERALRAAVDLQRANGVPTELLDPANVAERAPFVRLDGLRAAAFHSRDGYLDPGGLVAALDRRARDVGATVRTGSGVVDVRRTAQGWTLTLASGETLDAPLAVNAAGADAADVAARFGAEVPVSPVRRNLALVLDPIGGGPTPMVVDLDTGVLVRREAAGGWVVAYSDPADPPGPSTTVDPRFLSDLAARVGHRFPFLDDLPIDPARCWAGLYPETPDHHAIVGFDPHQPGLLHAVGFGGHGVMHAAAAGRAIAQLATTGACTTFDLHPLRAARFAEGDLVVEPNVF